MEEKNYYFIENTASEDWIGFRSYLDSLSVAIDNGANFIGLVADYGSGKSTLVDMLANNKNFNYKDVVRINLWNCDNMSEGNPVDIHRVFLHQLIDKLNIVNSDYFKKMIDKNYSFFDIKLSNNNYVYLFFLINFYLWLFLEKLELVMFFLPKLKVICCMLISILSFLCILIYRPMLAIKKENSNSREIDENDTKDLYCKILEKYFEHANNSDKLIICLEELDRYEKEEVVVEYLKEFYKFYKEGHFSKKVVFIIAIKPASYMANEESNVDDIKATYEKVFDFILNLHEISVHDYDSIVYDLLLSKKDKFPDGIEMPKISNLNNWKYLYAGNNIKIRDIKHRYNFAISTYLSVKESGIEKPNIDKCLFISYLEDEYNLLYRKLVSTKNLLNDILIKYANGDRTFNTEEIKFESEELDTLLIGLDSDFISVDYNYYFYKFPKNKKAMNLYEYVLYNSIFFDKDVQNIELSISNLNDKQIENLINRRINPLIIPKIVFKYPKLLEISYFCCYEAFVNTLEKQYNLLNSFENFEQFVKSSKLLDRSLYLELLSVYFDIHMKNIKDIDVGDRIEIRKKIVSILGDDSIVIEELFTGENLLISSDEINCLSKFETICSLIDYKKIDADCLKCCYPLLNDISDNEFNLVITFLKRVSESANITDNMFEELFTTIDFKKYPLKKSDYISLFDFSKDLLHLNTIKGYNKFINKLNFYCKDCDDYYLKLLHDDCTSANINMYVSLIRTRNKILKNGIDFFVEISKSVGYYAFPKFVREQFFSHNFYYYYVVSTKCDEKYFEIEHDKFDVLNEHYVRYFENASKWNVSVGPEMKKFLYSSVSFSKLDYDRLEIFNDCVQTVDIIDALFNIGDNYLINNYLSNIKYIKEKDKDYIFSCIAKFHKEGNLSRYARKKLLKNADKKYKDMLDARKYKISV